ncbi:hypothetical protein [Rhizobium sp. G21]|uniref:hypothetical protein n=1 Tax=Rhizobium sp. G21 TaxID=2758439 RepID=UPI00160073A5|nr:hypothetical protein [Rhizobium sp. G21]MBB1251632.1 hypothetical protein [Rhizobium sp. G21]
MSSATLAMLILTLALLTPIVRMKSFILSFCQAKTCDKSDRIFDPRPLAFDIALGIGQALRILVAEIRRQAFMIQPFLVGL